MTQTNKISGVVISYNRAKILETTLSALAFIDELIVVDKGSSDGSVDIARRLADRVIEIPWSPTVEESRADAIAKCSHEWIVSLDDDECLNAAAIEFITAEVAAPRADIYQLPFRHYILGRHSEQAYYWPEFRSAFFRNGAIEFGSTVHGGVKMLSDRVFQVPTKSGICIHHLSHPDVHTFIEKTNRYTSREDRMRADFFDGDLPTALESAIKKYFSNLRAVEDDGYTAAVLALRGIYDLVDCIKQWQERNAPNGEDAFEQICSRLRVEYEALTAKSSGPPKLDN